MSHGMKNMKTVNFQPVFQLNSQDRFLSAKQEKAASANELLEIIAKNKINEEKEKDSIFFCLGAFFQRFFSNPE